MKIANVWYGGGEFIWGVDKTKRPIKHPDDITDQELVILHGGEDISPALYGQKSVHAYVFDVPHTRDEMEVKIVEKAISKGIPIFGICRGAQLLCAMAGGTLFQHVEDHGRPHELVTNTGEIFYTNSAHHQMMRLSKDGILLAKTPHKVAKARWADSKTAVLSAEPEVEAAYWPSLNAVGIQGHPEWVGESTMLVKFCRHIVQEYLRVQIGV